MKSTWIGIAIGLVPWAAAAIFTNWFNELQPDGFRTLSVGHAMILLALQLGSSLCVYIVLDRREWKD